MFFGSSHFYILFRLQRLAFKELLTFVELYGVIVDTFIGFVDFIVPLFGPKKLSLVIICLLQKQTSNR